MFSSATICVGQGVSRSMTEGAGLPAVVTETQGDRGGHQFCITMSAEHATDRDVVAMKTSHSLTSKLSHTCFRVVKLNLIK